MTDIHIDTKVRFYNRDKIPVCIAYNCCLTFKSPLRSLVLRRVAMDLIGNLAIEKLSSAEIRLTRLQNGQTRPYSSWVGLGAGFGGFYYRCSPTFKRFVKSVRAFKS